MVAVTRQWQWSETALLSGLGCFALLTGVLVYMADRDAARVLLLPGFAALGIGPLFGVLGGWLPSFVHPFTFSLFSAAALPPSRSPAYGACAAWWIVNVAFEAGQHARLSAGVAESLQLVLGRSGQTQALANFFLLGTFDVGDIVAATAGAGAAAGVLYLMHRRQTRHAH